MCEYVPKPEVEKDAAKLDKNSEYKLCNEVGSMLDALSKGEKCQYPSLLEFFIDASAFDSVTRDKCMSVITPAYERFAQSFNKNTDGRGIFAVVSNEAQQHTRTRRQAPEVISNILFFSF